MFSTSIVRDWRRTAGDDKPGSLDVRITVNRKSYYIPTGIKVLQKHWAGAVVVRPDADALNNRLGIVVRRVNEKMNEFMEARKPVDVAVIKEYVFAGSKVDGRQGRLLRWLKEQIPTLLVSEDTRKHYWLIYDRLVQYGGITAWSDLTVENIYAWDAWLRQTVKAQVRKGAPEKAASVGTMYNYHRHFRALLNRAVAFGVITESPYAKLVGKFKRPREENVEYMTEEQMQLVMDLHPVEGTEIAAARDLFIFQMFTGLAYSDAQNFDIKQYRKVVDTIDGERTEHWVNTGKRIKTGVPYVSVLLPPVIDVLERNGWKVPQIPNQKYNSVLKTIGNVIGIERMHSHLARHTFATYMLTNDTKVQNLMRMMGLKDIRQTLKYAKVLAKDVQEEYERVGRNLATNVASTERTKKQ